MKKLFTFLLSTVFVFSNVGLVFAQFNPNCPNVYGAACPTSALSINKTVKNPLTGQFVDALGANDPTFLPGQEVDFRINVTNGGVSDLSNVAVEDVLPNFVKFVSGPGNFNSSNHTLSWTIGTLSAGQTQTFFITTDVVGSQSIPNTGITCVSNFSQATQGQMSAQDTSTFCIQTQVLSAAKQLPVTGPTQSMEILFGSLGFLTMSGFLYRKSINI